MSAHIKLKVLDILEGKQRNEKKNDKNLLRGKALDGSSVVRGRRRKKGLRKRATREDKDGKKSKGILGGGAASFCKFAKRGNSFFFTQFFLWLHFFSFLLGAWFIILFIRFYFLLLLESVVLLDLCLFNFLFFFEFYINLDVLQNAFNLLLMNCWIYFAGRSLLLLVFIFSFEIWTL